ncbi:MAG: hypothetical protein K8H75_14040 [Sulfuricella sp.]|nr:hypothetical protein [Sulfuricella sp.]
MPYVSRTPEGKIEAIFDQPGPGAKEKMTLENQELLEFLSQDGLKEYARRLLEETDKSVIRVLEDLIEVLLAKNLITFSDLPAPAQEKLLSRREVRDELQTLNNPILHKNGPI